MMMMMMMMMILMMIMMMMMMTMMTMMMLDVMIRMRGVHTVGVRTSVDFVRYINI